MNSEPETGKDLGQPNDDTEATETTTDPKLPVMYVHYVTKAKRQYYPVYLFQLTTTPKLEDQINNAIQSIVSGKATEVPPKNARVEWVMPSYAVFFLQDTTQKIIKVHFSHNGQTHPHALKPEGEFMTNSRPSYSVAFYRNWRKNKDGNDLGPNQEVIDWEVEHTARSGVAASKLDHDSSTTNTGP